MTKYENSGILFTEKKGQNPNAPNYKGNISITCTECSHENNRWLAGWIKDGKSDKFLTLSAKDVKEPKEEDVF